MLVKPLILPKAEPLFISFTTNKNGTFEPFIGTSDASIGTWEVEGFGIQNTNNPSYTLDGADRLVTLKISDFTKIDEFNITGEDVKGTIDLSLLTDCLTFDLSENPLLTAIQNPVNAQVLTAYRAFNNALSVVNMTTFSNFGGIFVISGNTPLTTLTVPATSNAFSSFNISNCPNIVTVDISVLTGLAGALRFYGNTAMTTISLPISSGLFSIIEGYNCTSLTSLDLSMFNDIGGVIDVKGNTVMTTLTLPSSTRNISRFDAYNCSALTAVNVSGFTNLNGVFRVFNNAAMTSLIFPISAGNFTSINFTDCPGLTSVDMSTLTGFGGAFRCYNCTSLVTLTLPTSTRSITLFEAYNCAFTSLDLSTLTNMSNFVDISRTSTLTSVLLPITANAFNDVCIYQTSIGVVDWSVLTGAIQRIDIANCGFTSAESDENIVIIDNNVNLVAGLTMDGTNGILTDGTITLFDGLQAKANLEGEGVTVLANVA